MSAFPFPADRRLTRREAAAYLTALGLPTAEKTLAWHALNGRGPAFCRWGRRPLYLRGDLEAWAAARLQASIAA